MPLAAAASPPAVSLESPHIAIESMLGLLRAMPEVRKIYCAHEGDVLRVWTVPTSFARKVRNRIYGTELLIMNSFRDQAFDFHVTHGDDETGYSDAYLIHSA